MVQSHQIFVLILRDMSNINKTIHYCWFGKGELPEHLKNCMASWREVMPEWKIQRWDENSFDVDSLAWTREAYKARKFAFVSDYVRLKALYDFGGIYLDTDVRLLKSLEPLVVEYGAFMGLENNNVLASAVMSAPKQHILIKRFIDYYYDTEFNIDIINNNEANVRMMTSICQLYGFIANGKEQDLYIGGENEQKEYQLHIFPQTYFCPLDFYHNRNFTQYTHAVHLFDGSWLDSDTKKNVLLERSKKHKVMLLIKSKLKQLNLLRFK